MADNNKIISQGRDSVNPALGKQLVKEYQTG